MVKQAGFTLVELIVTLLIMGILAYGSVQFIVNTSGAYASSQERSHLSLLASTTMERLNQELKDADPITLRTTANDTFECLEYLPFPTLDQQTSLPVSFCWYEQNLYRYSGYEYQRLQPTITELPNTSATGRVLIANGVQRKDALFQLVNSHDSQPRWVLLTLNFQGLDNHLLLQQEVRLADAR